jgi:hypothetical protein
LCHSEGSNDLAFMTLSSLRDGSSALICLNSPSLYVGSILTKFYSLSGLHSLTDVKYRHVAGVKPAGGVMAKTKI